MLRKSQFLDDEIKETLLLWHVTELMHSLQNDKIHVKYPSFEVDNAMSIIRWGLV